MLERPAVQRSGCADFSGVSDRSNAKQYSANSTPASTGRNAVAGCNSSSESREAQFNLSSSSGATVIDQLIPELNGQGITDGVIQGQVLRQLLHGELRQSLLRRIEQMPSLARRHRIHRPGHP